VAFPTTVGTGGTHRFSEFGHRHGPFISSTGNVYVLTLSGATNIQLNVWKATDPTSSFTAQDTSNRPVSGTGSGPCDSFSCVQLDDVIAISWNYDDDNFGFGYRYSSFDMATDTYVLDGGNTSNQFDGNGVSTIKGRQDVAYRSDTDVIVAYRGDNEGNMGVPYERIRLARRESGSWTINIDVLGRGKNTISEEACSIQIGDHDANDRMHILVIDDADDLQYSTYLSDNTWGHQDTAIDASAAGSLTDVTGVGGVAFDDGGTNKVRMSYVDASGNHKSIQFDDADAPGTPTLSSDISSSALALGSSGAATFYMHQIVVSGTTQYSLHVLDSNHDISMAQTGEGDDTWGADSVEKTLGTNTGYMSANVYDRDGATVIGLFYEDDGQMYYDEIDISAAVDLPPLMRHHANTLLRM
jgi:hypothetical protein